MAESTDGPVLQDLINLMLEAEEQDAMELFHSAKHAINFLASANEAYSRRKHWPSRSPIIDHRESLRQHQSLQAFMAQGKAKPGSTIVVSIDIEAGPTEPEENDLEPLSIMELGLCAQIVGDAPSKFYGKRFVVDRQQSTQRRMARVFHKGDTELVRHQILLSHRLSAAFHTFQEEFETVVMVGWDIQNDIDWLKERIAWIVPAGVAVVDMQRAMMHKHGLFTKPSLFDVLDRREWCGVAQRSGDPPVRTQMHNAGYDAYWTLMLAFCAGEDGQTICDGTCTAGASRTESSEGDFVLRIEVISREPWTPNQLKSANRRVVYECFLHGTLSQGKVSQARLSDGLDIKSEDLADVSARSA